MNNTERGNAFRTHVLDLLRTKYPDATTEIPVSWKDADIVFTRMEFGRRTRVAVECKFYEKKLTTSDFSKIYGDYSAALRTQDIDTLIVVSHKDVESASKQFLLDTPRLRFMTASQLEEWLIGLRPYIEGLARVFPEDDVFAYYVEGRFANQTLSAFDYLKSWIKLPLDNGIAVLGGYGLGKSSLAKRIASDQAVRYLADPANERMPILLRLGQVVHETELSGLFGKEFTAERFVEGYSFKTLMHLNEQGRLLVILDGFDEMKHAMTEADFRANFREFNKLRSPNAKILLLGRPNAFTSESADLLIKGMNKIAGASYRDDDFPAWSELNLQFFSREESREFLVKFLEFSARKNGVVPDRQSILERVDEIILDVHEDILQRPVQARIVGQLAASSNYRFKDINRFRLYNDFVEKMIDRDQEKRARRLIPNEKRREFLESLAWWAWTRNDTAQGVFRKDEVPHYIFDHLPNGDAIDNKAKRSEYLVSSLTEHKDSDILYFAHRSFQEFLVASSISRFRAIDRGTVTVASRAITPDVAGFLHEIDDTEYLRVLYDQLNSRMKEDVNVNLLLLMRRDSTIDKIIFNLNPLQYTLFDVAIVGLEAGPQRGGHDNSVPWLIDAVRLAPMAAAECAFALLLLRTASDLVLLPLAIAAGWERILLGIGKDGVTSNAVLVDEQHFGGIGEFIRDELRKVRDSTSRRISVALERGIARLMAKVARNGVAIPYDQILLKLRDTELVEATAVSAHLSKEAVKAFTKVLALSAETFDLGKR